MSKRRDEHPGDTPACPVNQQTLRPVGRRTVEALVRPEVRGSLGPQPYYFCDAPDCDVVYVSALGDRIIKKGELAVRVGVKETEDPVPLCYCFGYDRKAIRDEIRASDDSEIQTTIARRVREGECRCELTHPSGGCCLGDVARAVRLAKSMKARGLL